MDAHPEIRKAEYFPFRRMGLRSNPFRVLTEAEWMEVAVLPGGIENMLPDGFLHLQVLGDAGRGKTTTLLALKHAFETMGQSASYEYLPPGQSHFKTNLAGIDLFILDEAQRLSIREMRRLHTHAARRQTDRPRLVVSSHRDLSILFQRQGLPLQTCTLDRIFAPFLHKLLNHRLEYFAITKQKQVRFTEESVTALIDRFGSDLRTLEKHLYEVFQTLSKQRSISDDSSPLVLHPKSLLEAP
jgi:chromosomal replication initiation ATPase DnaA